MMGKGRHTSSVIGVLLLALQPVFGFSPLVSLAGRKCLQVVPAPPLRASPSSLPGDDDRRSFLNTLVKSTTITTLGALVASSQPASAYEKSYPVELGFANGDTSRDLQAVRGEAIAKKKQKYKKSMDYVTDTNPFALFRGPKDVITTGAWAGALWLLTGSRSNPLVTPLANALYPHPHDQDWLKDRNDGLFASLPLPLSGALFIVFFSIGIVSDRIVLYLAEGSANISLQLATVFFISGASLELGRLASGEKLPTRVEFDRTTELRQEFNDFATKRLQFGGNCHRNDIVRAFRRYNPKYRQGDSEQYPLTNLEIEKLLKEWNRAYGGGRAQMTSAGFYNGLSVNAQADAFV